MPVSVVDTGTFPVRQFRSLLGRLRTGYRIYYTNMQVWKYPPNRATPGRAIYSVKYDLYMQIPGVDSSNHKDMANAINTKFVNVSSSSYAGQ